MKTLGNISRYIEAASSRLDDLAGRARASTDGSRPLVQESLLHLASTLEELRVSEEELRAQADVLASSSMEVEGELRRYRDLFQLAPDAYLVTGPDGLIREANRAAGALLGVREEYLPGKPLLVFVHEDDRGAFRRQLPWARSAERFTGWRLRLVSRGGALLRVDASVSAATGADGSAPELCWTLREAPRETEAPAAPAPEPRAPEPRTPGPDGATVDAAVPHRAADPAWCAALLAEAGRTVDPSSRAAAERLAGLYRGSLALALYLGLLRPGDRIPGIREVARATRLNHKTVARAYRSLQAEGVLEIRDRSGVYVASLEWTDRRAAEGDEAWAAELLTEAWRRHIGIPALPEVVRRWTAAAPLRCACVEADPARRAALCDELREAFGFACLPVAPDEAGDGGADGVAAAVAGADLVVTTPFHTGRLRPLARALGKPLMVATASAQPAPGAPAAVAGQVPPPLPRLTLDTARSISETVVLLSLERAPDGGTALAGRAG